MSPPAPDWRRKGGAVSWGAGVSEGRAGEVSAGAGLSVGRAVCPASGAGLGETEGAAIPAVTPGTVPVGRGREGEAWAACSSASWAASAWAVSQASTASAAAAASSTAAHRGSSTEV